MTTSPSPAPASRSLLELLRDLATRHPPKAQDVNAEFARASTLGERLSDRLASFGGSWTFILLFLAFLAGWAYLNTEILGPRREAFDPYPYVFLNLFLSMLAALQAPIILMSQNRQAAKDRLDAANDYEVNVRAEMAIVALHEKLDALRDAQIAELRAAQERQLTVLADLQARLERLEARVAGTS